MQKLFSLLAAALITVLPSGVSAQLLDISEIQSAEQFVSWEVGASPSVIGPGGSTLVSFQATLDGDWKMYALDESLPPRAEVLSRPFGVTVAWPYLPEGVSAGDSLYQSPPETGFDDVFEMTLKYFHEQALFVAPLSSAAEAATGLDSLVASIRFQICSDEYGICLNPTTSTLKANLRIDEACTEAACSSTQAQLEAMGVIRAEWLGEEQELADSSTGSLRATSDFEGYRSGGFLSFILLAIGAGLAALLTPCVFPMIPLTVSYFAKEAEGKGSAVKMALLFGLSVVVLFTAIGILASLVVGAAGAQQIASNPWVNLFITLVLVGFALSLLGLYEIRLPNALINFMDQQGRRFGGWVGILFMGLTITLVSFSCTAPFVGGLLAAASAGTWTWPLVGMVVFSVTFVFPFVLLALFPQAVSALPKSGSWMNLTKVVLGFVELAAAVKFLSNADLIWEWGLVSRPLGIAFIIVVFFLAGLFLLGKLRLAHVPVPDEVGVGRMMSSSVFFVLALYMIPGLLGAPLNSLDAYLPPRTATDVSILNVLSSMNGSSANNALSEEDWFIDDIDGAFDEALALSKPVFIDFSGYTCTNCRQMEANVFIRSAVASRFESDFVLLRLYTDGLENGDSFSRYQLQLTGTVALPTFAIVAPANERLVARASGMMDVEEFAAFLDGGSTAFRRTTRSQPES